MRVGIVYHSDYPWNRGIERIGKALHEKGHKAFVICKSLKPQQTREDLGYITVCRSRYFSYSVLNKLLHAHWPLNIYWLLRIVRVAKIESLDLLSARELPLAFPTIVASKLLHIPVVFDMRENYPAAVEVWGKESFVHYISRNKWLVGWLERICLRLVDHVLVVIDEQRDRLVQLGFPADRITVNINTPSLDFLDERNLTSDCLEQDGRVKIIYVGSLDKIRGLENVIEAIPYVLEERDVQLIIAGVGPLEQELRTLVDDLQLNASVLFLGWVPFPEIPSLINQCDIGIVNHIASDFTNTTMASKLFDYMALAKPVISSGVKPISRIIEQERCGVVSDDSSPKSIAAAILQLVRSPELRRQMGERGREVVLRTYNWEKQSQQVVEVFQRLVQERRRWN